MSFKAIVAGVDESPEGAWAATVAWNIAQLAGARCHLVHATRQLADFPEWVEPHVNREELSRNLTRSTHERLEQFLTGNVPFEALAHLEVNLGRPKTVLPRAVEQHGGFLLVLGGKHHTAMGRWLGGSTALHAAQTTDVPTLIAIPFEKSIERVLVTVDMSHAAGRAVEEGMRFAKLFDAQVKVLHVIEPMPDIPSYTIDIESERHFAMGKEHFELFIAPLKQDQPIDLEVVAGPVERSIAQQAKAWNADVVVVGSHGKGWVERLLLGSTARRLINDLPASLLVVPVTEPA
jgi:nucleotide-binding universal stress UspA family protein